MRLSEDDAAELLKRNPHLKLKTLQTKPAKNLQVGIVPTKAKGKLKPRKMNKLEARYAAYLEGEKAAGRILWYEYEAITLRLGDDCRYTPDFVLMLPDGEIEVRETKGFWEEDAKIKIRVASERYPFRFVAIHAIPLKEGGGWREVEF
jgi:hypothetical protein